MFTCKHVDCILHDVALSDLVAKPVFRARSSHSNSIRNQEQHTIYYLLSITATYFTHKNSTRSTSNSTNSSHSNNTNTLQVCMHSVNKHNTFVFVCMCRLIVNVQIKCAQIDSAYMCTHIMFRHSECGRDGVEWQPSNDCETSSVCVQNTLYRHM